MTHIDLVFPAFGGTIPLDHGYSLYGALSRCVPAMRQADWLAVHPVRGTAIGLTALSLHRESTVTLRIPAAHLTTVAPLSRATLEVCGVSVELDAPVVQHLSGAPSLEARVVLIKLTNVPCTESGALDLPAMTARFEAEIRRQLDRLQIRRPHTLLARRSIRVSGGARMVGFSVRVSELSPDESMRLQIAGLGGKRAIGCGLFAPSSHDSSAS